MRPTPTFLALLLFAEPVFAVSLDQIDSPRPDGWVTDQTATLSSGARQRLNQLGDEVAAKTGAELAVVLIGSTEGANPRKFATDLFNLWGIGDAQRDNGILLLVAIEDRKAELILGDGIDEPAQIQASARIMQEVIVPSFKAGRPEQAVVQGATAAVRDILGFSGETALGEAPGYNPDQGAEPEIIDVSADVDINPPFVWWSVVIGLLALLSGGVGGRAIWRRRPRTCKKCQNKMVRLGEQADDAHLTESQQTEERIGSVDYDVWGCRNCGEILRLRYGAIFTTYSRCPGCSAKTRSKATQTLVAATYDSGGTVEVTEDCVNCDYHRVYHQSTPRRTRSSSSNSSSSSSSGFSGGSSSGSGSSGSW